ncbi:MAG: 3-hydroxyacyl-CoA dehydrogenase family protein [Thermoplasmatales archaeon]|nr:3-hydroxyacyl-CoA dehydrogenase family protein [Thermoplasmatales archaeon]
MLNMSEASTIKKVAVIGAGNMGAAIAEVMAYNGISVMLKDQDQSLVDSGMKRIEKFIRSQVSFEEKRAQKEIDRIEKLGITLNPDQKDGLISRLKPAITGNNIHEVLGRVKPVLDYEDLNGVDLVIEAVFEKEEIKKKVFSDLSRHISTEAIVASNTSSLSITSLATALEVPSRAIIAHFFNPPYTLPLVEIVPAIQTSRDVVEKLSGFIGGLKNHRQQMVPIVVKEVPGFVVNRILVPMINEAVSLLDQGVASREDIDRAMKLGAGMPMGPLELADMIGLDVTLDVCRIFHEHYGDSKYRPSVLLKKMVDAGMLGKKSGRGFYQY